MRLHLLSVSPVPRRCKGSLQVDFKQRPLDADAANEAFFSAVYRLET